MRTKEFIDAHCKGRCQHYEREWGCDAYGGEECDAAFCYPHWRGKSMRDRVDEYCEARRKSVNHQLGKRKKR